MLPAGKVLVRERQATTADESVIHADLQMQAEAVAQRVAADPVHKEMALLEVTKTERL